MAEQRETEFNANFIVQADGFLYNRAVDAEVKVLYQEDEGNIIGQYIIFCKVYDEQILEAYADGRRREWIR